MIYDCPKEAGFYFARVRRTEFYYGDVVHGGEADVIVRVSGGAPFFTITAVSLFELQHLIAMKDRPALRQLTAMDIEAWGPQIFIPTDLGIEEPKVS